MQLNSLNSLINLRPWFRFRLMIQFWTSKIETLEVIFNPSTMIDKTIKGTD